MDILAHALWTAGGGLFLLAGTKEQVVNLTTLPPLTHVVGP